MSNQTHTRRRLLATIGAVGTTGALAGCSGVLGGSDDSESSSEDVNETGGFTNANESDADAPDEGSWIEPPSSAADWEQRTENDADVSVRAADALDLRVNQCSRAEASTRIADGTGTLRIAFGYQTEAEQWYESPGVFVVEDGEERNPLSDDEDGIVVDEYETAEGNVDTTVEVDGTVHLRFRIEPSSSCDNGDHANTYLRVRDLVVEEAEEN